MSSLHQLKINNSKDSAVKTGKWFNPGAKFYDQLLDSFYCDGDLPTDSKELDKKMKDGNYLQWNDFIKEAYLIAPVKDIKNSPYGRTPFSNSGCKYPHHVIKNGELILSVPGIKAAYTRAKQQGVYSGELKIHLERHMKELGELVNFQEKIEENFDSIYDFIFEKTGINLYDKVNIDSEDLIFYYDESSDMLALMEKSHGTLKYEYRIGVDIRTGKLTAVQFKLDPNKIISVGNKDAFDGAYILNKITANPEKSDKLGIIYDKIDELKKQGKTQEADAIKKKLDTMFDKATEGNRAKALEFVKKNIRKYGHIDYISDESIVDRIFHKDGGSIQSVQMVPTLSNQLYDFLGYLEKEYNVDDFLVQSPYSYGRGPDNYTFSYERLFNNTAVRKEFVKYCKEKNIVGEKYEVGKLAGKNKYRSTKILWDSMWLYKKYTKSPMLRGYLDPYAINKNFKEYDGTNKPKRAKLHESYDYESKCNINDLIRESLDWIDRAVHNEEFLENNYQIMMSRTNPNELMTWMRGNIRYGWRSIEDDRVHGTGDNDDEMYFYKYYRLQSPVKLAEKKVGVCWDQCELERQWFTKNGIEHGVFYIELQDDECMPTHTFLVYKLYDRYWWFEHSWGDMRGIRGYDDLKSLILDVVIKHQNANDDKISPVYVSWLQEPPSFGITCEEYMNYAHSQRQLDVNNLPLTFYEYTFTEAEESKNEEENNGEQNEEPPEVPSEDSQEPPIQNETQPKEPPSLEEPSTDEKPPEEKSEAPVEETSVEEPKEESKPESRPKQVDKAESDKNGVRRKKLYIAFIEWCKEFNPKNTFGSIFDKDAFKVSYPFVPDEMRYFYRLANPMLCVLAGDLTFFPVAELRKINSKNSKLDEMMVFAATPNDLRVFNKKDKKVYRATEESGSITLAEILGDTYDLYIQKMVNKGDILNGPIEESVDFFIYY